MSGAAGGLLAGGCASSPPLRFDAGMAANLGKFSFHGLAESLPEERDYAARIEGHLPAGLRGSLYRNGPGLFERNGVRKRSLLDGDGMIQHFRFHDRGVHYRSRFVRTEKYRTEAAAGRFIYPSWSTQAPGGWQANFWITEGIKSQAGISVYIFNKRLYAFDESSYPYELDPLTLETIGETTLGIPREETIYSAHSKIDPANGEWLHFGVRYGAKPQLHISVFAKDGRPAWRRTISLPRFVYIHDWFVSSTCLVVCLHPVEIDFWPALLGFRSLSESLRWSPEKGNLLLVIPRNPTGTYFQAEVPACFMWHSVNAFDDGATLSADFVGYDNPDHFVGRAPMISAIMQGREGEHTSVGLLRRYSIDLRKKGVTVEVIAQGSYEWPRIDGRLFCRPHGRAWLCEARRGEFFWTGLACYDTAKGKIERYDFGERIYCGEPVFVPRPGAGHEEGWVLSECYDGVRGKSFLAVLEAGRLADGPLAMVHLSHHVPFSYHGWWQGEGR